MLIRKGAISPKHKVRIYKPLRKGISEVVGAFIVVAIITASIVAIFSLTDKQLSMTSKMVESAMDSYSKITEPFIIRLIVDNNTGKLKMYAAPFEPHEKIRILIINKNNIIYKDIVVNSTYLNETLLEEYNCEKINLIIIKNDGTIHVYNALRDPNVNITKITDPYTFSCDILKNYKNNCSGNICVDCKENCNNVINYFNLDNNVVKIIEGKPATIHLYPVNMNLNKTFKLLIEGEIGPTQVNISAELRTLNDTLIGESKYNLSLNGINTEKREYLTNIIINNINTTIYIKTSCIENNCIIGLDFETENITGNMWIVGEVNSNLTVLDRVNIQECIYDSNSFIAPLTIAPAALSNTTVAGTCKEYYGIRVNFTGVSHSTFATHGPLGLLVSTVPTVKFKINSIIYINKLYFVTADPASIELKVNTLINYKRIEINPLFQNKLTKIVFKYLYPQKYIQDNLYMVFKINNYTIQRNISGSWNALPLNYNGTLRLLYSPPLYIPFQLKITKEYNETKEGSIYQQAWRFTSYNVPVGLPQYLPALILLKDALSGQTYLISLPIINSTIKYNEEEVNSISPIISGIPLEFKYNTTIYFNEIIFSLSQGKIYVETNIYKNISKLDNPRDNNLPPGTIMLYQETPYQYYNFNIYKIWIIIVY